MSTRKGLVLALALAAAAPLAAELRPAGREIRLAQGIQTCPASAALPDGRFLLVWSPAQQPEEASCSDGRVFGQYADREGRPLDRPFTIARVAGRCVSDLQIGFPAGDSVAVSWLESPGFLSFPATTVTARRVTGRRAAPLLHASGVAVVHLRSGGALVVSGVTVGVPIGGPLQVQRFDAAGRRDGRLRVPLLAAGQTGAAPRFEASRLRVAEVAPGTIAVVWQRFGRVVHLDGSPGSRFELAEERKLPLPSLSSPLIASDGEGRFVVAWTDVVEDLNRDDDVEARAQLFDLDGASDGGFEINIRNTGNQRASSIEIAPDGRLAASWLSFRKVDQPFNVVGRLFTPDGAGLGHAVQLPSNPAGSQVCAGLRPGRGTAAGRWLAVWLNEVTPGGAGDVYIRLMVDE